MGELRRQLYEEREMRIWKEELLTKVEEEKGMLAKMLAEEERGKKIQEEYRRNLESKFKDLKVELERELETRILLENEVRRQKNKLKGKSK